MTSKASILVLEDDPPTANIIEEALTTAGFTVKLTASLFQAKGALSKSWPDLAILDRMLPDGDGLDFCRQLRSDDRGRGLPVLFLTTKKSLGDKVAGLAGGGDDYLAKPFHPEELVARVSALLRRVRGEEAERPVITAGDLEMDLMSRRVRVKEKTIDLRSKEFDLLEVFLRRRNTILSRVFLLERVWGYAEAASLNSKVVDVTVGNLRNKLGTFGKKIVPVRSHGYQFEWDDR